MSTLRLVADTIRLDGQDVAALLPHVGAGDYRAIDDALDYLNGNAPDIEELNEEIYDLDAQVTRLQGENETLEDELKAARREIETLKRDLARAEGVK